MKKTLLYQITETSKFMMSFVIITQNDNVIIIDGGREEDMPLLKKYVGGRHICAWILTHPHFDHISGFVSEVKKNNLSDFNVDMIYYNFPPYELIENHNVADYENYKADIEDALPLFNEILPRIENKTHITLQGESIEIDEVKIDFIFSYHEGLDNNLMNDSSLVFKLSTPRKSVMFLGDIGPLAGDILYFESKHLLKADMVQMAHHGGLGCSMEVYAAIEPKVCFWCCRKESYNGEVYPAVMDDKEALKKRDWIRMHKITTVRRWMKQLGVKKHYVSGEGTNRITL